MRDDEVIQDLLLLDFRAYLQNEILKMLRHITDVINGDEIVSNQKYTEYVGKVANLIMEWKKHFKDEPYVMEVYLK